MLISNKACSGTVCARAGNPGATLIQDFSGFLLEVFVVSVIALTRFSGIYLELTTEFFPSIFILQVCATGAQRFLVFIGPVLYHLSHRTIKNHSKDYCLSSLNISRSLVTQRLLSYAHCKLTC